MGICLPCVAGWLLYILLTGSHGVPGGDMFAMCSLVGYYIYYSQAAMESAVGICLPCVSWLVIIYNYSVFTGSHGGRGGDMFAMC